ncbi:DUF6243 family protein [Nocardiopsis listeri]|uniref:DUF6243 family protein n=1 Tax=Nocardiopsis listeri TaxID=53440 RepID=UPI0008340F1C|nr:DUF6243 family protein [Nocardiopsis listeri]
MAKNNNMLGMGGQRTTVARSTLRGGKAGDKGGATGDARERKEELLRRFREKNTVPRSETSDR